jgi:hypothetical protein
MTGIQKLPQMFQGCILASASKQSHIFALQQYDKFLTGAKEQVATDAGLVDDYLRRTALIVCLLVVCIETLQFKYTVATRHAQDGLRLMQEYLDTDLRRNFEYGTSYSPPYAIEDELLVRSYLRNPFFLWQIILGFANFFFIAYSLPQSFKSFERSVLFSPLLLSASNCYKY